MLDCWQRCALEPAAGCTTNHSPGDILFTTQVHLEMALGTLNDPSGQFGAPGVSLNAVTSFRNQNGNSAFLIPGPSTLATPSGAKLSLGSLFSYGNGQTGLIVGLPPTYPPNGNGIGFGTGFIPNGAAATAGTYSLTVNPSVNGQTQQYGVSATLPAAAPMFMAYGGVTGYASGGASGGGTITLAAPPAGVTESLVVILCDTISATPSPSDPCNFFGSPNTGLQIASAEAKAPNLTAVTLPAGTLFQGDSYFFFAIGADYSLVENGAPFNASPTPALANAGGTADITVSGRAVFSQ